jgi:holo-[acyl-carrier protein] synthase
MILGVGIDAVTVARFAAWHLKPRRSLRKLFSDSEIDYCLSLPARSAERFAVRFAAREAFFKALQAMQSAQDHVCGIPFLRVARAVEVVRSTIGVPTCVVDWDQLETQLAQQPWVHLSLTHTETVAQAIVILESQER